ncbi:MAG: hypothetical protein MO846_11585 [Candidatus Devosia symbiotica]|nr:hypothetical protein [Candidatus Devosia symbiotica]
MIAPLLPEAFDYAQALERYAGTQDGFLTEQDTAMTATFARYDYLSVTLECIRNADPVTRLQLLLAYYLQ